MSTARRFVCALVLALCLAVPGTVVALAADTPSYGNGDCWRNGTPQTCRVTWIGPSQPVYFRAVDQFSGSRSGWKAPAQDAVNNWTNAPGPQYYSFTPTSNDTWIYLNYSWTGDHGLQSGFYGLTWNCDRNSYCVDTNTAMNIWYTNVYLNHDMLDSASSGVITEVVAHESGHGMALWHNTTDHLSLMWASINYQTVPQPSDIGVYPGCSNGGVGMNCIYGWGD